MTTFLVVNGPNLEMLGKRDPSHYGTMTLAEMEGRIRDHAQELGAETLFCQSNHEADLVNFINRNSSQSNGIIINPAGLTRVGYPLLDACIDSGLPVVEVHLSNIHSREEWRADSIFSRAVSATVGGMRWMGYIAALEYLTALIKKEV